MKFWFPNPEWLKNMKRIIHLILFLGLIIGPIEEVWGQDPKEYYEQGVQKQKISDFKGALEAWEKGLAAAHRMDNKQAIATFLNSIGLVYEKLKDYLKALSHYEQSMKINKEIGDRKGEGITLGNIGVVYEKLYDYPKAISYYEQSLRITREIGDRNEESETIGGIAAIYLKMAEYTKALSYYEQSLKISRETGDRMGEEGTLNDMGAVYSNLGDYQKALFYYEKSLIIAREFNKRQREGNTLGNIGLVYDNLGDYPKALSHHEQSLKISRDFGDRKGEGITLGNLGLVYGKLGDYPKALIYYEQSLQIKKEIRDRKGEGMTLNNLGDLYRDLGDYPKSLSYLEQSMKISREVGDKRLEIATLANLGTALSALGEYSKALYYYDQSLKMSKEIGDRPSEMKILGDTGNVFRSLGDHSKALSYYAQALKVSKEIGAKREEGATLGNMGIIYENLGDYSKALSLMEQSIRVGREIGDKKGETITLHNIGLIYANMGDYLNSLSYCQNSLNISKEIGLPTANTEANIGDIYMEQGKLREAFDVFQKINDPIRLGRYYLRIGDFKKAEEAFALSLKADEAREMPEAGPLLANCIGLALSNEGLKDYPKAIGYFQRGIELIEKQRGSLGRAERERFLESKVWGFPRLEIYNGMIRAIIKGKGRDYQQTSLFYAERAKSKTFLEMLATRGLRGKTGEDKTILEKEKGYQQELLVLRKRIEVLEGLGPKAPQGELPQLKKELEKRETEFERFIKEVKQQNSELASLISVSPTPIEKIQSLLDQNITLLEYYTTEDTLYAWLLTKEDIKAYEIPIKEKDLARKLDEFLLPNISTRSIKVVPVISMAVGEEYKKETTEKEREKNRQNFLRAASELYQLIIAPFEKEIKTKNLIIVPHGILHKVPFSTLTDGQRYMVDKYSISVLPAASVIEHVVQKRKAKKETLLAFANPKTDYAPLEFAEIEGKAISKLFPQNEVYSREKATETIAKKKGSSFNIIHFATHGEFNDRQPLQSGLLLAKDEENDGYFQVHEIFGMDLRNANLVTLSACETALSKIMGGDDLVGLSRGFIYAGTPSILATLWKVDDPATSKIMEYFYRNWKQGMSKPESLRRAQIALKNIPEFRHPYYWAPFVMIGDWQ
jgi:CHAT domain-containing protein/Tfp pilus assembly protein PilF